MKNILETIKGKKGLVAKIYRDENAESPRAWDNLGHMVCWHRRYNLGDNKAKIGFSNQEDFKNWMESKEGKKAVIIQINGYEHGGLTISAGKEYPFNDRFDSGIVGFIFLEKHEAEKNFSDFNPITWKEQARKCLLAEIETYNAYLIGNVYGYVIEDENENHLDSCCGYYGREDVQKEAMGMLEYHYQDGIKQAKMEKEKFNNVMACR